MGAGLQRRPQPPRGPPPGDRPHVPSRLSPPASARAASGGRLGLCSGGGGAGAGPGGRTRGGSGRHRREEGVPSAQPAQARTTHCGPSVRLPQLGGAGVLGAPPNREQTLPLRLPSPGRPGLREGHTPGCSGPLKTGAPGKHSQGERRGGPASCPRHTGHTPHAWWKERPTVTRAAR